MCVCVFQEWRDGLASPEDLSPATLQSPNYVTDSMIGCSSLPNAQVGPQKTQHNSRSAVAENIFKLISSSDISQTRGIFCRQNLFFRMIF